ncbi:MAG: DUF4179 domain-containing protein [Tepidiformaceae bacterium]
MTSKNWISLARSPRRLTLVGGVILGLVAMGVGAKAQGSNLFGGADVGVNQAVSAGLSQPGGDAVTHEGVTIRITGVVADDIRTVVGLAIEGRNELGEGAFPAGQAQLVDQDGRIYREVSGSADQQNPRLVTRYYPPLDRAARSVRLEINGLAFVHRSDRIRRTVDAQWTVSFTLSSPPQQSIAVSVDDAPQPLGAGSIVIDSVKQGASGTAMTAHLVGFSVDAVPELGLRAELVDGAGNRFPVTGMRLGFGANRELVEMQFPRLTGAVVLEVVGLTAPNPHAESIAKALSDDLAKTPPARWQLALPG